MNHILAQIDYEIGKRNLIIPFKEPLESRYQQDTHADRCRHLILCLTLGVLTFNSFLIWKLLLQPDDFLWAATQMLGTSLPCAAIAWILIRSQSYHWREIIAVVPSYVGLAVVYNVVINGAPTQTINQALFIFCWPLMVIWVNTCMRSPFKVALCYNIFAILLTSVAVYHAPLPLTVGGLMMTGICSSAFFSLLGNYWASIEGRRSYLYRLREQTRAASLTDANHNLQRLSETDVLTGLANRRQIQPYVDLLWSQHTSGKAEGAVLLIDIDLFKQYNDHYGHLMGDECLRQVASALKKVVGAEHVIARFGGEEFLVVLINTPPEAARQVAALLLQSVRNLAIPHLGRTDGFEQISVSIGLAHSAVVETKDSGALLDQADQALYRAKRTGRDRLEDAGCIHTATDNSLLGAEDLRLALVEGQFSLAFQPLYRLVPHALTGYECLIRWEHPHLGAIPPDLFIPMAERSGLIGEIGDWVLEQACLHACQWPKSLSVSVNLSPLQLADPDLPARVAAVLVRTGLVGKRLFLELTEGAALTIDSQVIATVTQLQRIGVRLALDDFGKGFANLTYLLQLPFQVLKIDRESMGVVDRGQRRQILSALLALGRAFGMEVLAEGVETTEDLALLRELGFDHAQGYLLGRPQPMPLSATGDEEANGGSTGALRQCRS